MNEYIEFLTEQEAIDFVNIINQSLGIPVEGNVTTTYCDIEPFEGKWRIIKDQVTESFLDS